MIWEPSDPPAAFPEACWALMPRAQILAGRTFRPAEQRAGRRSSASGTKLTIRVVDRNIAVGGITDIALASVTWASRLCAAVGLLSHYPRPPRLPCATGIVNYSAHSRVIGSAEMDDRKYLGRLEPLRRRQSHRQGCDQPLSVHPTRARRLKSRCGVCQYPSTDGPT